MERLKRLDAVASAKNIWIAFGFFFVNAVWLMVAGAKLAGYSSSPKLDFHLKGYDLPMVLRLFSEYGDAGRKYYFWLTVIDTPFPFFVAFFGVLYATATWCRWNLKWLGNIMILACLLFLVFDNVENVLIYKMLYDFPNMDALQIAVSGISTQIKLYSLLVFYALLPITGIVQLYKLVSRSKNT